MILSEQEIRNLVRLRATRFADQNEGPVVLVEELQLDQGSSRIDMVFLGSASIGIEIKSPKDTLYRLPDQSQSFSRYFDYMILIADSRFILEAKNIVPDWWGLTSFNSDSDRVRFRQVRKTKLNPALEIEALLQLLWKDELLWLIKDILGASVTISRKSKKQLRAIIIESDELEKIRQSCVETLSNRLGWRSTTVGTKSKVASYPAERV